MNCTGVMRLKTRDAGVESGLSARLADKGFLS